MRKGVGLAAFDRTAHQQTRYQEIGNAILSAQASQLTTQLDVFKAALTEFARQHSEEIKSSSELRVSFVRMCSAIGVDPLASSSNRKGSFWAELLGSSVNDFYFELAVRVLEVCRATRHQNGGLMDLNDVERCLSKENEMSGGSNISE